MTTPTENRATRTLSPSWPWWLLALALLWTALLRLPLVLNAETHLDSDLAVDGLTLLDAAHGHWRWHYPGTPYIGTLPVLTSLPQQLLGVPAPIALVSGGTLIALAVVALTFVLAWSRFGAVVAAWGLVPLAFASTGTIWLSGRVTGGHLAAAVWHAGAFALLGAAIAGGRRWTSFALGCWCGLGFWLDSMFALTLAGVVPAAVFGWWRGGAARTGLASAVAFAVGCAIGVGPRVAGNRLDPYDAYGDQFRTVFAHGLAPEATEHLLREHARLLACDCLPRLIAGHRLPGLQADPDPAALSSPAPIRIVPETHPIALMSTGLALTLFAAAAVALAVAGFTARDPAASAVVWGLLITSAATVAGFLVNQNIFNSDNYRYLVDLLVPWSVGFGLAMRWLASRGKGGAAAALLLALSFAALMTLDAARWYSRFGWIDSRGLPLRRPLNDPILAWLDAHREVVRVEGDYWDVYRLAFLTRGRVQGVPFPEYPDRFQVGKAPRPVDRPAVLVARRSPRGNRYLRKTLRSGGVIRLEGRTFTIVSLP